VLVTRDPALDGLRGVAIGLVVLTHAHLIPGGWVGVNLFFALSGYLITSLLLGEHERTGTIGLPAFYWRRAVRLGPALVVALAGMWLLWATVGYGTVAAANALVVLLYLGNFARAFVGAPMVPASWSWSLAIEEQFYLLWPLALRRLLRTVTRQHLACGLVVLALSIQAARLLLFPHSSVSYYVVRGDDLLLGAAIALSAWVCPRWLTVLGLGCFAVMPLLHFHLVTITVAALASAVLVASTGRLGGVLSVLPLRYLGRISYPLYLWGGILTAFWDERGATMTGYLPLAGLSVVLAALSTHLLEEPLRRRLVRSGRDAEVVQADARAVVPQPVLGRGL
jgi:peptidoglycan/LPS O-acetylase OafA/YrhL